MTAQNLAACTGCTKNKAVIFTAMRAHGAQDLAGSTPVMAPYCKTMGKKISKDSILLKYGFTEDDIDHIKAMLYDVNSGNHCCNPPHSSWVKAKCKLMSKYHDDDKKDFEDELDFMIHYADH